MLLRMRLKAMPPAKHQHLLLLLLKRKMTKPLWAMPASTMVLLHLQTA
jgi:hypothetical protein